MNHTRGVDDSDIALSWVPGGWVRRRLRSRCRNGAGRRTGGIESCELFWLSLSDNLLV